MRFLILIAMLFLGMMTAPVMAQEQPDEIQFALQDLTGRVDGAATMSSITNWTWQERIYNDASLGCPQPGQAYAQVQTPGYQFEVEYQGRLYDYRVAENGSNVILCAVGQVPRQPEGPELPSLGACPDTWLVQPGDTLYSIARACSTTVNALMTANPDIVNPSFIIVGQEIVIPDGAGDGDSPHEPGQFAVAPVRGPVGTEVQLTALGFQPNIDINVGFGPVESEYDVIITTRSGINGSVNTLVTVPQYASPTLEWVFVLAVPGGETRLISDVFDVTSASPEPTEEPPLFTRTDIYLIALEDGGQSGQEVGCGDSLVPVEVVFEPTVAPLTAALEELFAIDTRFYGQSGLYNALYQSDLQVEGIDIDANGHAEINLSGTLNIGGTCDSPRVEAQIEQTALQYNTIDSVDISINGEAF